MPQSDCVFVNRAFFSSRGRMGCRLMGLNIMCRTLLWRPSPQALDFEVSVRIWERWPYKVRLNNFCQFHGVEELIVLTIQRIERVIIMSQPHM